MTKRIMAQFKNGNWVLRVTRLAANTYTFSEQVLSGQNTEARVFGPYSDYATAYEVFRANVYELTEPGRA